MRLCQRFALFTPIEGCKRLDAYKMMGRAYDARSKIVHGGEVKKNELVLPGEGQVELPTFVDAIEEGMRAALHKAIELDLSEKSEQLADWDNLIFGDN